MRTMALWRVALAWLALASPPAALAQANVVDTTLRDFMTARSFGIGGAQRALGLSADAVDGNPAAMSLWPRYQTELSGAWEFNGRLAFATLALVDSQSNPKLALGVSYHFATIGSGASVRTVSMETVGASMPVASWLTFGISARHLLMSGAASSNAVTGDAGLAFRFFDSILLGLSGHNLVETNHPELSRFYAVSLGYVAGMFSAGLDLRFDFGAVPGSPSPAVGLSAGAEYILGVVPVRMGFQNDPVAGRDYLSAGIGLMTETGNIDIAYRHQLNGTARLLSIGVRLGP